MIWTSGTFSVGKTTTGKVIDTTDSAPAEVDSAIVAPAGNQSGA